MFDWASDWIGPVIDWFAGEAPGVAADVGTEALGSAGGMAVDTGGTSFLGDLWNYGKNFLGSDAGKTVLGTGAMLGMGALAGGPEGIDRVPGNMSYGPMPNMGLNAKSGSAAATPAPPGTNASPIFNEGKQPTIKYSEGIDVEDDIRKRQPTGGMGVTV
jgi:hypothetical protein